MLTSFLTLAEAKPWHYWAAPILLGVAVLICAGIALGYYLRVMGGRRR